MQSDCVAITVRLHIFVLKKRNFIVSSQKDIVIDEKTVVLGKVGPGG